MLAFTDHACAPSTGVTHDLHGACMLTFQSGKRELSNTTVTSYATQSRLETQITVATKDSVDGWMDGWMVSS